MQGVEKVVIKLMADPKSEQSVINKFSESGTFVD